MALDFSNAQLPTLLPLERSYAENAVEADLKQLFLDLFKAKLADDVFDANVLGAAHLGSFNLVRRAVNNDGLVLMQGDREEASTRYLYRAWKSGDAQGRGLHFLRIYLQMLFPGLCQVDQLWHDKSLPYPTGLSSIQPKFSWWLHQVGEPGLRLNGSWGLGRPIPEASESRSDRAIDLDQMYLTSRVEILLDFSTSVRSLAELMHIIRSVIPARLVPVFRFWLSFGLHAAILIATSLAMQKHSSMRYAWCGRVISEADDARWALGKDGEAIKLPQRFGSFRVGERRGGKSAWRLNGCRVQSSALVASVASPAVYRLPGLGEPGRRLDGSWKLSGRSLHVVSRAAVRKSLEATAAAGLVTTFHDRHQIRYTSTPARLGRLATLASWRRLDGRWKVGERSVHRSFGFAVRRDDALLASSTTMTSSVSDAWAAPEKLSSPGLDRHLSLDGGWRIGGPAAPEFKLVVSQV